MRYDPIMCMMVDDPAKAQDADPIAALSNFKKTAEYGDIIKIDIGKGKTAIVQKEANGWYVTIGNEKVKGTFNVIAGYLKSAYAKNSKAQDELSLAQKKQVVTELNGFLKKSYNFSDESEYARAYEDLRHMFTTGSRKSISGLFENTVKKTGSHDSVSALDKAIRSCDRVTVKYDDAIGDTHTFFKETEEEAKKWIDQGKFPHGAAFNVKIDGKLYKKEAR